jgi:hypothetical protein
MSAITLPPIHQTPDSQPASPSVQSSSEFALPANAAHQVVPGQENPTSLTPRDVLQLQRMAGNRAVCGLLRGGNPGPSSEAVRRPVRVALRATFAQVAPSPVIQRVFDARELSHKENKQFQIKNKKTSLAKKLGRSVKQLVHEDFQDALRRKDIAKTIKVLKKLQGRYQIGSAPHSYVENQLKQLLTTR